VQRQATRGAKAGYKRLTRRLQKAQRQTRKGAKGKLQKAQRQAIKDSKAGQKRRKGKLEKAQRQARKDASQRQATNYAVSSSTVSIFGSIDCSSTVSIFGSIDFSSTCSTFCSSIVSIFEAQSQNNSEQMPTKYTGYLKECRMAYRIRLVCNILVLGMHIRFILYRIYICYDSEIIPLACIIGYH
jgi:hypothetical protein